MNTRRRAPAGRDPRHGAGAARPRPRLRVRAALRASRPIAAAGEVPALEDHGARPPRRLLRGRQGVAMSAEPTAPAPPLLEVRDLDEALRVAEALARDSAAGGPGGRRRLVRRSRTAETLALVGESGCGKTTDRQVGAAPDRADRGLGAPRRRSSCSALDRGAMRELPPAHADHLPGPVRVAEPAPDRRRDRGRADAQLSVRRDAQPAQRRERVAWLFSKVGLAPGSARPLSARVLRRPAPAPRHRAGARAGAEADRLRRAGVGARRLGAGAGHQPADRPAGRVRHRLPVRRPRPRGGRATSATASR